MDMNITHDPQLNEQDYNLAENQVGFSSTTPKKSEDSDLQSTRKGVGSTSTSYRWCKQLTNRTAKNFAYAFPVLPTPQRRGMEALYAFMRVTDDLADEDYFPPAVKKHQLNCWKQQLQDAMEGRYSHILHPALHDTIKRFGIPIQYLEEVIDGVSSDLEQRVIQSFAELYRYCYQVASTVGLACIHIWGFKDEVAKKHAESAGIAFQLTNILRDLWQDYQQGRIYLPEEDWRLFQILPGEWSKKYNEVSFQKMMELQIQRARYYYSEGDKLLPYLNPPGKIVFSVMRTIYGELLDKIEEKNYNVFEKKIRLSTQRKIFLMLRAFFHSWCWCKW